MKSNNTDLTKRKITTCIICDLLVLAIAFFMIDTPIISNTEVLMILFICMMVDTLVVWMYDICNPQ